MPEGLLNRLYVAKEIVSLNLKQCHYRRYKLKYKYKGEREHDREEKNENVISKKVGYFQKM